MLKDRAAGILLPVFSLPSKFGIGDFGPQAYNFIDQLLESQQFYWQILPLNPSVPDSNNSPYSSLSAFAGNTVYISPELLVNDRLLEESEINNTPEFSIKTVDYKKAVEFKSGLLTKAYEKFKNGQDLIKEYEKFCWENHNWLEEYVTFFAFYKKFNQSWSKWPEEIRDHDSDAVNDLKNQLKDSIEYYKFEQFIFYRQYYKLKQYASEKGIKIFGDLTYYVDYNSVDVWANQDIFKLDEDRKPEKIAGVPPDYFSETGQLWGNPVYDWDELKKTDYKWWLKRLQHNLNMYDLLRIDHFRGLVDFWEVQAGSKTAEKGQWIEVPYRDFFRKLFREWPFARLVAEDLGKISASVREAIYEYEFPSMKVLLFAFEGDVKANPHCLYNHNKNSVVYTGTHDTNTAKGWFRQELTGESKKRLLSLLGDEVNEDKISWSLIRLAYASPSSIAIIPLPDILEYDETGRINNPKKSEEQWNWRYEAGEFTDSIKEKLKELTENFGRY